MFLPLRLVLVPIALHTSQRGFVSEVAYDGSYGVIYSSSVCSGTSGVVALSFLLRITAYRLTNGDPSVLSHHDTGRVFKDQWPKIRR
jgi:hypothetical protein